MQQHQDDLKIEDFEYELPPELIAQSPQAVREESRLLILDKKTGRIEHKHFHDLLEILRPGDVLVVNDTRVMPARFIARRKSGGNIKILLLKSEVHRPGIWEALVTPIKRLKEGEELFLDTEDGETLTIRVDGFSTGPDGFKRLLVDLGPQENVFNVMKSAGFAPLPPYIQRQTTTQRRTDLERYQTVFAKEPGAVAAPTAGLHFSLELMERLRAKGIIICPITLHVGAGTFKPVETTVEEHTIEPEQYNITEEAAQILNAAKADGRRIIAVGTTSLRTLESACENGAFKPVVNGVTSLYVKPGYKFVAVDAMVTNFHLSRSSLLILVSAFAGLENIKHAYASAIEERFRFFSYGDAMFIE